MRYSTFFTVTEWRLEQLNHKLFHTKIQFRFCHKNLIIFSPHKLVPFSTYNMPTRKQFYNVLLVKLSNSYDDLSQFFSGFLHFPRNKTFPRNQLKETVRFLALNWENGILFEVMNQQLLVISFFLNTKQLVIVILLIYINNLF